MLSRNAGTCDRAGDALEKLLLPAYIQCTVPPGIFQLTRVGEPIEVSGRAKLGNRCRDKEYAGTGT